MIACLPRPGHAIRQCRRPTLEMTSDAMGHLVLSHVLKDSILRLIRRGSRPLWRPS